MEVMLACHTNLTCRHLLAVACRLANDFFAARHGQLSALQLVREPHLLTAGGSSEAVGRRSRQAQTAGTVCREREVQYSEHAAACVEVTS